MQINIVKEINITIWQKGWIQCEPYEPVVTPESDLFTDVDDGLSQDHAVVD